MKDAVAACQHQRPGRRVLPGDCRRELGKCFRRRCSGLLCRGLPGRKPCGNARIRGRREAAGALPSADRLLLDVLVRLDVQVLAAGRDRGRRSRGGRGTARGARARARRGPRSRRRADRRRHSRSEARPPVAASGSWSSRALTATAPPRARGSACTGRRARRRTACRTPSRRKPARPPARPGCGPRRARSAGRRGGRVRPRRRSTLAGRRPGRRRKRRRSTVVTGGSVAPSTPRGAELHRLALVGGILVFHHGA